jgi:hypothetical protein
LPELGSEPFKLFYFLISLHFTAEEGDQMSLSQNRPKYVPTHFFVKIIVYLLPRIKVAQNFGLPLYFSKNYPKEAVAQMAKIRPIWSPCR